MAPLSASAARMAFLVAPGAVRVAALAFGVAAGLVEADADRVAVAVVRDRERVGFRAVPEGAGVERDRPRDGALCFGEAGAAEDVLSPLRELRAVSAWRSLSASLSSSSSRFLMSRPI
jgi:hypothetical protein